jgi:hypothetical protein
MNFIQHRNFNHQKFGRGGQLIRARGDNPLTIEQIAEATPSVLAEGRHHSRSEKYTFISTRELLEGMMKEGFQVFEVRQGGSKYEDKRAFTKHMIRFRHARDVGPTGQYYSHGIGAFGKHAKVGDSIQEIIITNSHDGTSAWEAFSGWFRIACLNGLIVADIKRENVSVKIPHKGNVLNDVVDASFKVIDSAKDQAARIEHMQSVPLSLGQQRAFAMAAADLRWEDEAPVGPDRILEVRREADMRPNVWNTFNVVQENLVRGGLNFVRQQDVRNAQGDVVGRRDVHTSTRPVMSVDGDVKLNRALWILAEEMAKLAA